MPPLEPGETELAIFHTGGAGPGPAPAPASLLSATSAVHSGATSRVDITTMGMDHALQRRQVNLRVNMSSLALPASWTGIIREQDGKIYEHEASCKNAKFQCTGEGAWCLAQEKVVCQATRSGR